MAVINITHVCLCVHREVLISYRYYASDKIATGARPFKKPLLATSAIVLCVLLDSCCFYN